MLTLENRMFNAVRGNSRADTNIAYCFECGCWEGATNMNMWEAGYWADTTSHMSRDQASVLRIHRYNSERDHFFDLHESGCQLHLHGDASYGHIKGYDQSKPLGSGHLNSYESAIAHLHAVNLGLKDYAEGQRIASISIQSSMDRFLEKRGVEIDPTPIIKKNLYEP